MENKLEILKLTLEELENHIICDAYPVGLCHILANTALNLNKLSSFPDYKEIQEEFGLNKYIPNDIDLDLKWYWWPLDRRGYEERIKVIKNIINEYGG